MQHVRVARRPSGGSWSASIDISPSPANVQSLSLSVRPDGFAWAVWGDTRAGASNQDIWGSRYDPNLNTWSTPVRLDDDPGTTANQLNPTVAFGAAEEMVAWRDNRLSANGDTQARRLQNVAGMTDHFVLSYDGLNRLTKISGPVGESFALDGNSNVTSRTGPSQTDSYDGSNRLTGDGTQSYIWYDSDRLHFRGADSFGWDEADRMTSSTVAGSARTYAYNGDGLLQSRTGSGATTFLWDPSTSPSRELKQGSDNIIYGLGPLYVVKADTSILTFARDGSKNVRAELNSAGGATAAFRYRAYGQIAQSTSASPSYLGLASQLVDPSGLYYMRARWYDPSSARFLVQDPAHGAFERPSSLNEYAYALGNPIIYADPSGMCAILCTAIIGAVIGGVVGGASYALQQVSKGEAIDPGKLALNVGIGAVEGALIGAFLPGAGFATGAIWGAGEGFVSDLSSQLVGSGGDWDEVNWAEVGGATFGGAAGGFVSGGALGPVAGVAVKDTVTIASANVASAGFAFTFTLGGWALGESTFAPSRGGGGRSRLY